MVKRQKLSPCQLDELPDEVIPKIVGFLDLKELLLCGQVSKRLQAIANDESLWLKLNMRGRLIPYDFIEKAIGNGCQYLSLPNCDIIYDTGNTNIVDFTGISSFNLKYLNVSDGLQTETSFYNSTGVELVHNCSSLQKLSVANLFLDLNNIQHICKNGQTLEVLDLGIPQYDRCDEMKSTKVVQDLFSNCVHLTELNITENHMIDPHIQALVDNLTPTILKVSLAMQDNLQDEHVKKLVKRCNKITHLDFCHTSITNDSVLSIIEQLNTSLEGLNVFQTHVDFATLVELRSMPALQTLICDEDDEDTENLKQQLPHISIINEERCLYIAKPFKKCLTFKRVNGSVNEDCDWIWEFREKEQNLFAKVEDVIYDPYIDHFQDYASNLMEIPSNSLDDSDDSDDSNDE